MCLRVCAFVCLGPSGHISLWILIGHLGITYRIVGGELRGGGLKVKGCGDFADGFADGNFVRFAVRSGIVPCGYLL